MSLDVWLTVAENTRATTEAAIYVRAGGSTVQITREEWDKMPSEEQNQYINEYMSNVVDVWVDEGEED